MTRVSRDALGDLVYEQIVRMLLNHDLKPGEKILRKKLAAVLGVSQTPINEAINRLVREGILEQQGSSGLFVRVFTNKDLMELFAVRAGLEGTALHLCMEEPVNPRLNRILNLFDDFSIPIPESRYKEYRKKDQEFHGEILKISGNRVILDFIRNFEFILRCYQKGLIRTPDETLMEHRAIVQEIRNGNPDKAQQLIMSHHWKTRDRLKEIPDS
jgi:DNA-binding GntR family transcriptional regulator